MDLIDSAVKSLRSLANERRERYPGIDLFFFSFFSLFPSLLFVLSLCFYLFIYFNNGSDIFSFA